MEIRNWAGNVVFSTDVLHRPTSVEQLQELVSSTPRLRALGSGHSFSPIADSSGALVSVAGLQGGVEFTDDTVSFPAGMRYGELTSIIDGHGKALHNLGSLPHICVAGACSTGTHGSGDRNGNLSTAARAVEFVSGDGSLVQVAAGDPSFDGVVLALGALGVMTRLTLAVEPAYEIRQDVWLDLPLSALLANLDEIMAAGQSVSVFTSWQRPDVVDKVWVKSRSSSAAEPAQWGARPAESAQHPVTGQDASSTTQQLGVPGPWHERLPHFRLAFTPSTGDELQSEWFVARADAAGAIEALRAVSEHFVGALLVCELRTVAADSLWLSPCRDRASLALHFTWRPESGPALAAVRAVEAALEPFDPRVHWAKVFDRPPTSSGLPAFRQLVDQYDPERRFGNDYLERYVY